jgi:hypothetical protein
MTHRRLLATLILATLAAMPFAAQGKHPDLSGTWQQDRDQSKALTEKNGHPWRVAGASSGGATPAPGNSGGSRQFLVITQSSTEIVMERRIEEVIVERSVYKLDGTVSVNARRNSSRRSTSVWKGDTLVTTGTFHMDLSDGSARDKNGNPILEINREFVTTHRLMPDGTIQVEDRSTENGVERVSWTVYVRVK